jgi:hypothetical protein
MQDASKFFLRITGLVAILAVLHSGTVKAQGRRTLPQALSGVTNLQPTGRLSQSTRLHLAIGLPLRNQAQLTNLLRDIYDPTSPEYHRYLTPEQFTQQFGPEEKDYQALVQFAETNGLAVRSAYRTRMLLDVEGNVGDIERAFHVALRTYPHPREPRTFFAPDQPPSVPASIRVLAVSGLDNFILPKPTNLRVTSQTGGVRPLGGGSHLGSFFGNDFRTAYAPGVTLDGSGQSVGILAFDGYYTNDVENYKSLDNAQNVVVTNVLLDGFNGSPGANNLETALDIEASIAMAPGLSSVIVYEGFSADSILTRMAADNVAKQLSSSWTFGMSASVLQAFQEFEAQGQVIFQASGDDGAYPGLIPEPIEMPDVVTVGGTVLLTDSGGGPWQSETVWWLGGGGFSTSIPIPTWQQGIDMSSNQGSTTRRNFPDVAMVSESVMVIARNGSQFGVAGTSASAPLWAGFAALVNQQEEINGNPPVGFLNPLLYAIGKGSNYNSCFHDVTVGNNTNASSPTKFFAAPGYDLCTGWGTPKGSNLINALAPFNAFRVSPGSQLTASGLAGNGFSPLTQTFSLSNATTSPLSWSLVNTSVWLNASPSGGVLDSNTTIVTVGPNSIAQYLPAGVYVANLWFNDLGSGVAQNRQFVLTVNPLAANGDFETGNVSSWTLSGSGNQSSVASGTGAFPQAVHTGSWGAELANVGLPLGYLSQTIPTTPGRLYSLSFWLNSAANPTSPHKTTPNQFLVSWNGTVLFNQTNIGIIGWTNLQFLVSAAGTNSVLQFGFRNDPWAFGLDDIQLRPILPASFQGITMTNNATKLTWGGATGLNYQVQYKTNLLQANWSNVSAPFVGTNFLMTTSNSIGADPQRFYRILTLP